MIRVVTEVREDGVLTVGMADSAAAASYVLLQRCIEALDRQPGGFADLYIEHSDQLKGGYGGLRAAVLRDYELHLAPDDEHHPILGSGLTLSLALSQAQLNQLAGVLEEVLPKGVMFLDERGGAVR